MTARSHSAPDLANALTPYRWQKLGHVYVVRGEQPWAQSHAYTPTSFMLNESCIRVLVAFLDENKVGRMGFVDVAADNPLQVLDVSESPVLDVGEPGTFDADGVTPLCVVPAEGRLHLYYTGWQRAGQGRYSILVGLAVSEDGGKTFRRLYKTPILERSDSELFFRTASHVIHTQAGWKMWYIAGSDWIQQGEKSLPTYNMRYLESDDGLHWGSVGRVCLEVEPNGDEYGFGRPFVMQEEGLYKMWYSIRTRSHGYRLGYAESPNGLDWERKDHLVGLDVSAQGWDSEMLCFSCIQKTQYGNYMFYNGNNYGESGFGVALCKFGIASS